jgi:xanthine dehydrogenase accessory factor
VNTNVTVPDAGQRAWQLDSEQKGPNFRTVEDGREPRLIVFGAVPLSAALARAAHGIGWIPYVVDPRERFAKPEAFPDAAEVLVLWPAEAYARLDGPDARTAVVALTHAAELDDVALTIALGSEAFYIGAMGSRRTQTGRRERLAAAGITDAQLARLSGPAGLDIGGDTVDEAALAILAEAVAALHGRDGAPLSASANAIHVDGRP